MMVSTSGFGPPVGRGYEVGKGQYLIIEDEELDAIGNESHHSLEHSGRSVREGHRPCAGAQHPDEARRPRDLADRHRRAGPRARARRNPASVSITVTRRAECTSASPTCVAGVIGLEL